MRAISTIGIAIGVVIVLAIAFAAGLFLLDLARVRGLEGPQKSVTLARHA